MLSKLEERKFLDNVFRLDYCIDICIPVKNMSIQSSIMCLK